MQSEETQEKDRSETELLDRILENQVKIVFKRIQFIYLGGE